MPASVDLKFFKEATSVLKDPPAYLTLTELNFMKVERCIVADREPKVSWVISVPFNSHFLSTSGYNLRSL
jgi:hypothetical protein